MDSMPNPSRRIKEALAVVAAGLLLFAILSALAVPAGQGALIRDSVAMQLLQGATEGRQALVGSVWWAPLPSLLLVPILYVLRIAGLTNASLVLAAVCAVALPWLMYRFCRLRLTRGESVCLVAALAFMPGFAESVQHGSLSCWTALLAFGLLIGYHAWRREHSLRALALFGSTGGLIAISGIDLLAWAVILFGLFALHEIARHATGAEKRATLLLASLPALYAAGLWVLMNWLIMGAPLYFLRTWTVARGGIACAAGIPEHLAPAVMVWLAYLLILAVTAALARQGAVLCLVAAAMAWVLPLRWFGHAGLMKIEYGGWLALTVCALAATALAAGALRPRYKRVRTALCLAPLAIVAAIRLPAIPLPAPSIQAPLDYPARRQALIERIGHHVACAESPPVRVFVPGYQGLGLLHLIDDDVFKPALDLNFHQVTQEYHGHRLYALVHRPEGIAAFDHVHAAYPGLYRRGGPITLHDSDWGEWRLYEITPQGRISLPSVIPSMDQ